MLNRINTVPSMMALIRLLKEDSSAFSSPVKFSKNKLDIHALHLLELTQRSSDVMRIQDLRETQRQDPVLNVLKTFTSLIGIESFQTLLDFRTPSEFTVADYGGSVSADMILLPWVSRVQYHHQQQEVNPFEQHVAGDLISYQVSDADFASTAYSITHCTVGLFIDRGFGHVQDGNPNNLQTNLQIIVPFTNCGSDDCAALIFALRLQMYRQAEVLVLKYGESSNLVYATTESIQNTLNTLKAHTCKNGELLNTLFSSAHVSSNVVLRSIQYRQDQNDFTSVLDSVEKPLDKHDLIVLGRSIDTSNATNLPYHILTPLGGNSISSPSYSRGFKFALGDTAYQILSAGTLASLVVIQAPGHHHVSDV